MRLLHLPDVYADALARLLDEEEVLGDRELLGEIRAALAHPAGARGKLPDRENARPWVVAGA